MSGFAASKAQRQAQLFATGRTYAYKGKVCKGCKVEYQPTSGQQQYCSRECWEAHTQEDRTCRQCGGVFQRRRSTASTKFCSWRCRDAARYGEALEVPCPVCGEKYSKRRENQKYCSKRCQNLKHGRKSNRPHSERIQWSLKLKGEDLCRNCGQRAVHLHHVVPRSKSAKAKGEYALNGIPLCFACHRGWHDRKVVLYRGCLRPEEAEYAASIAGQWWVDKNYPKPPDVELIELVAAERGDSYFEEGWQERNAERIESERDLPPAPGEAHLTM